jgi:hypothetical protein
MLAVGCLHQVSLQRLLMSEESLVLGEGRWVGVGSLLLGLLNQKRLLMSEKRMLLLWSQRWTPLTRPHVDGPDPRVLRGWPGSACPAWAGV